METIAKRAVLGALLCGITVAAVGEGPPPNGAGRLGARAMDASRPFKGAQCLRYDVSIRGSAAADGLSVDGVRVMVDGWMTASLPDVPQCTGEESADAVARVNVEVWTVRYGASIAWHVEMRAGTEAYGSAFQAADLGIARRGGEHLLDVMVSIRGLADGFADAWHASRGEQRSSPMRPPSKVTPRVVPIVH